MIIFNIFQILHAAHLNRDTAEFGLVFANKTIRDILMKVELDEINKTQNFKFKLTYTIDKQENGWEGATGHITKDMISQTCPPPSDDTLMLTCGPPVFCKKFLLPMLLEMGYKQENIFEFQISWENLSSF